MDVMCLNILSLLTYILRNKLYSLFNYYYVSLLSILTIKNDEIVHIMNITCLTLCKLCTNIKSRRKYVVSIDIL